MSKRSPFDKKSRDDIRRHVCYLKHSYGCSYVLSKDGSERIAFIRYVKSSAIIRTGVGDTDAVRVRGLNPEYQKEPAYQGIPGKVSAQGREKHSRPVRWQEQVMEYDRLDYEPNIKERVRVMRANEVMRYVRNAFPDQPEVYEAMCFKGAVKEGTDILANSNAQISTYMNLTERVLSKHLEMGMTVMRGYYGSDNFEQCIDEFIKRLNTRALLKKQARH